MNIYVACIVAAVVGVLILMAAIHARAGRARRRHSAGLVAEALTKKGLTIIPTILNDYREGDYPKLIYDLDHALINLLDPKKSADEFEKLHSDMTAVKINDPAQAANFLKQVASLAKNAGVLIPTA